MTDYQNLFNIVHLVINDFLDPSIPVLNAQYSQHYRNDASSSPATVYVQAWLKGELMANGCCYNTPLEEAVQNATVNALEVPINGRFILAREVADLSIQLFIKGAQETIEKPFEKNISDHLDYYENGLTLSLHGDLYELLPSTMVYHKLRKWEDQIAYLLNASGLDKSELETSGVQLYSTQWTNIIETSSSNSEQEYMKRGRFNKPINVTQERVAQASIDCAKRLMSQQMITGAYSYEYNALSDTIDNGAKMNMVRMAGTAFSMAMLSASVENHDIKKSLTQSAEQAYNFLFSFAHPTKNVPDAVFISQNNEHPYGKLGSTALSLLGLQFGSFYQNHALRRTALINTILSLQEEDGSFKCYIGINKNKKSAQNYFPGEALLALCYELKNEYNAEITASILKSFSFYRNHFAETPDTAFVLWQVSAWALFYDLIESNSEIAQACLEYNVSKDDVANFVYEQTDWILQYQHTAQTTHIKEFVGGFPNTGVPHSVSSCYLEAVIRAAEVAHKREDNNRLADYQVASISGLEFLLRLQLKEEESFLFREPQYSVGGISGTLISFQVRSDRDQHAITAFIAAIETPCLFEAIPNLSNADV